MLRIKDLPDDVRFFREHAGFSFNPATESREAGRLACAFGLAMAEQWAKRVGLQSQWFDDYDYTVGQDDDLDPQECSTPYRVQVGTFSAGFFDTMDVEESVGGVLFKAGEDYSNSDYARVIEAELAYSVMLNRADKA